MVIRLDENYNAMTSTALLGYVGETNARPVSVEGMEIDGADRYVLTIDYGDGVQYEVDITGGQWTPTADILRSAQTVSCQICAKKLSGQEYILVKKSRIFRLRIGAAIGDVAVPSPDVAMDALDRIDAIGRQTHADMQTAVTAAETATTAAENAEKSATDAEKSADTAEQAASRAETAQASAETSATQADTAKQGAETARTEAVTAQNAAKISAAQASASAQQTTADKATVADHAAKVAEDRTAAETAAQTAQAVADSLPEDYVTAVAKIAENTAEISAVKLTDKELQRRVNALYDLGQGITHKFETDSDTAYTKTVPTGGKLMSVKNIGGRSVVFNQIYKSFNYADARTLNCKPIFKSHKYLLQAHYTVLENVKAYLYFRDARYTSTTNRQITKDLTAGSGKISWITSPLGEHSDGGEFGIFIVVNNTDGSPKYDTSPFSNHEIFDLTAMFGSGNEPSTAEDFEKIFPADYYLYNAGEIVSAGVTEVAVGETTHTVPEAIRNLPGYGWSAGTARNYVDYENKKYYQCVQSVNLETLTWTKGESVSFKTHHLAGQKLTKSYSIAPNFICPKYSTKTQNESWGKTSITGISATSNVGGYIYVNDTSYADADAFKQAMQGVMLYYELETPIVTDISSLIPDDFLRNIEAEAGGSVTFKNSNGDDYRIPVPSEEEYIVKLSEVGGTT